ncbi:RnfH family protein [Billgrantia endophytica]|uniref:UPF0125 protein C1H69_08505 n=1 Tax=Billgrantia endophytica TaxID=2033802 RepID=A0A2N7U6A4_9GAMM|nr:RnfH family protein [Halomonas endophytica]PMR75966.1 RnfH family protein [Halomonas endophytica]
MAASQISITVEVAFALPERQHIVTLRVADGTTVRQAVEQADLAALFPDVPAGTFELADLGIFGRVVRDPDSQPLREGDRVEVYRSLRIDPKAARAQRAAQGRGRTDKP